MFLFRIYTVFYVSTHSSDSEQCKNIDGPDTFEVLLIAEYEKDDQKLCDLKQK